MRTNKNRQCFVNRRPIWKVWMINTKKVLSALFLYRLFFNFFACFAAPAKQQGDAPNARQAYNRVDNAANKTGGAAEYSGYEIEAEQPYKEPVQRADNHEY